MIVRITGVFCAVLTVACAAEDLSFPPGFKFGVASAAYQVEGAWNISEMNSSKDYQSAQCTLSQIQRADSKVIPDKGESVWDRMTHKNPDSISDGNNADVACDSYNLWRRDIEMIEEIGAHYYRFSISWPRLLPTGFSNTISEDGAKYYSDLIDGLLEKGIEPVVTLYHWDLPQSLFDLGGWTNPLISDWFADYARVVYSLYGDRVKTWITLNEPITFCDLAYNTGILAPGIIDSEVSPYLCNKYSLMAHAKAWRIYDEEFKAKYQGQVSLANQLIWIESETPADEELAELARENMVGRYSHPVYSKEGGWPPAIEKILAENSKKQGYPRPNLPPFTPEEIEFVKGTYDFYAMNHYTSRTIRHAKQGEKLRTWPLGDAPDLDGKMGVDPSWKNTQSFWYFTNPEGIRHQLAWLKKHYGDIKIIITENGYPNTGGFDDFDRVDFYKTYLKQLLLSIKEDGVNVTGYTAWTLMDNFEWMDGYASKFGLYEVDFESPLRTRTPRSSATFYSSVIKANSLEVDTNSTF